MEQLVEKVVEKEKVTKGAIFLKLFLVHMCITPGTEYRPSNG